MQKAIKFTSIVLILTMLLSVLISIINPNQIYAAQTVSSDINSINDSKYPGIKDRINLLKRAYPNWQFKILYTGLDWNDVINNEYVGHGTSPKNLVNKSSNYQGAWICAICGDRPYDNGSWRCASQEAIKYMMDPRNSLNASDIFQFEELKSSGSDVNIVRNMINGTFLAGHEQEIINSANKNQINAYFIAARIIQEQGKDGTVLAKGSGYNGQYVGYYNLFNISATGEDKNQIILNGLARAQKEGWNSIEKSIDGGISFLANNYVSKGQYNLYLQKFDVEATNGLYQNQYMQNIMAAESEGVSLRKAYENVNAISSSHTFVIPVYENMPSSACTRPSTTGTSTISTDMVKVNVNSSIRLRNNPNGGSTVGWLYKDEVVTRTEKATSKVAGTYWDKVRKADGTEGYVARETYDYEPEYKLYLVPVSENNNGATSYAKGDVNGDGRISSSDYVLIKNYIMGSGNLSEVAKQSADYNNDGKITSSDYVLIKNYIMNH